MQEAASELIILIFVLFFFSVVICQNVLISL